MPLNFLQFVVHSSGQPVGALSGADARVVVAATDLFQALERAVETLRKGGWIVDDLERFVIGLQPPAADSDPVLAGLTKDAELSGIAWALAPLEEETAFPPFPPPVSSPPTPQPIVP